MKKKILHLFLLLIASVSYTQNTKTTCDEWSSQVDTISSIKKRLKFCDIYIKKTSDSCLAKILVKKASIFRYTNQNDSIKFYCDKAISVAKKSNATKYLSSAYIVKSDVLIEEDSISKAKKFLNKARLILEKEPTNRNWGIYFDTKKNISLKKNDRLEANIYIDSIISFFKRIKDTFEVSTAYHNKGYNYRLLSDYKSAATNYIKSIEIREAQKYPIRLQATYYELAFTYYMSKQYRLSKKYAKKSISLSRKKEDDLMVLLNYLMLSPALRKLNEYDNALVASDSALVLSKKLKNKSQEARALKEKGWIFFENNKDYNKAEHYFIKAYNILKPINDKLNKFTVTQGIVDTYIEKEDFEKAKKYLEIFDEYSQKINVPAYSSIVNRSYLKYYEKSNQLDLAYKHLKEYHTIQDSINSNEITTKINELEKKYETEKKEKQIVELNKEKELQIQIAEQANFKQNIYLIAALLLLGLLIIGFWLFKKLKQQERKLSETNSVKNRLFSIIAHDLRGMIIPFQRTGKIVKFHIDNNNQKRAVQIAEALEKNSESLSNMLDNLLNWSLDQMNGYTSNPTEISLETELKSIINSFDQHALYKKTTIDLQYDNDISVLFDKGALHVIFRNLISNALKFTENGTIKISFNAKEKKLNLHIQDNGIGMTDKQTKVLFDPENYQTTQGTKGEKGTGLGLNLVYRFVKMQNGTIKVSSEKDKGTSFNLSFPIINQ